MATDYGGVQDLDDPIVNNIINGPGAPGGSWFAQNAPSASQAQTPPPNASGLAGDYDDGGWYDPSRPPNVALAPTLEFWWNPSKDGGSWDTRPKGIADSAVYNPTGGSTGTGKWEDRQSSASAYSGGGGGGVGSRSGGGIGDYTFAEYANPGQFQFQPYQAPAPFQYGDFQGPGPFVAPTMEEATSDQGYQFRLKEGQQALERSASARGTLLTSGTLKDLTNYGQEAATQQYDKIYGQKLGEYTLDYGNKADTYDRNRNNAYSAYQTNLNAAQTAYGLNYNSALGTYQTNLGAGQWAAERDDKNRLSGYQLKYAADQGEIGNLLELTRLGQTASGVPASAYGY